MSLFGELKRRNVFRVGIAYVVAAWLVSQVAELAVDSFEAPAWVMKMFITFMALGFPFALIFAWAFELTPEGLKKEKDVDRGQSITHATGRKLDFAIIAVLVVALGYFAWEKFAPVSGRSDVIPVKKGPDPISVSQVQTSNDGNEKLDPAPFSKSIAVLPFVNMSNDPDQEYFSDGISEELLNVLAKYPGLRVAARTSSFQFKGENRDINEIAKQLRVNHVLEGSVRKAGTRLRITAQLIDAETGFHLWSESFDRELDDVFAIQDEISAAIGEAMKVQLNLDGGAATQAPKVPAALSALAYDAFLQGRQGINLRSRESLEAAVGYLERALRLDESYAPAHAQLAIAVTLLRGGPGSYGDLGAEEASRIADPHIARAFELVPDLPEAHGALALAGIANGDYETTIRHAQLAVDQNPSYVDAMNWLYLGHIYSGNYAEGFAILEQMVETDPLSIIARINYVVQLSERNHFESARAVADSMAAQSPRAQQLGLANIYLDQLHFADGIAALLRAHATNPDDLYSSGFLQWTMGLVGLHDEARRFTDEYLFLVDSITGHWEAAIERARLRSESEPGNRLARLDYAMMLYGAGEVEAALPVYESLWAANDGRLLIHGATGSTEPTAQLAYLRMSSGDSAGFETLLARLRQDEAALDATGLFKNRRFETRAITAAAEGDESAVLTALRQSVIHSETVDTFFDTPAFASFRDNPEFQAIREDNRLKWDQQQHEVVQMICFDNPVPDAWQPLPETCEGIVKLQ